MDLQKPNRENITLQTLLNPAQLVTVLAGAGISMDSPSNLASAKQMMDCLIDYGCIPDKKDALKSIPHLRFEYVVQQFRDQFDPKLKLLNYFLQPSVPNSIHQILAVLIQHGHFVLTTNFDCLIERAMAEFDKRKLQA